MEFPDGFEDFQAGGVTIVVDLEAELFEGGLHEAGIIDGILEVVLCDVAGITNDERDPFLSMAEGGR